MANYSYYVSIFFLSGCYYVRLFPVLQITEYPKRNTCGPHHTTSVEKTQTRENERCF